MEEFLEEIKEEAALCREYINACDLFVAKLQIKGVSDSRWKNRYFAFCKDGIPYVFCGGTDSWSAENGWDSTFPIIEFTKCRFADEEMEKKYWKD